MRVNRYESFSPRFLNGELGFGPVVPIDMKCDYDLPYDPLDYSPNGETLITPPNFLRGLLSSYSIEKLILTFAETKAEKPQLSDFKLYHRFLVTDSQEPKNVLPWDILTGFTIKIRDDEGEHAIKCGGPIDVSMGHPVMASRWSDGDALKRNFINKHIRAMLEGETAPFSLYGLALPTSKSNGFTAQLLETHPNFRIKHDFRNCGSLYLFSSDGEHIINKLDGVFYEANERLIRAWNSNFDRVLAEQNRRPGNSPQIALMIRESVLTGMGALDL